MKLKTKAVKLLFYSICFFTPLISINSPAQSADYHREESPAISWNRFVLYDSRAAACAGISFFTSAASAAIANPALMHKTDGIATSASYSLIGSTAYQYSMINTGVYYSSDKQYEFNPVFSSLSAVFNIEDATIGIGYYKQSLMELPDIDVIDTGYSASAVFSGKEDAYYLAISYPIADIYIGAKLTFVSGNRYLDFSELYDSVITISQNENYDFDYFVLSFGTSWEVSDSISLSAAFDYPIKSVMNSEIERSFDANITGGGHIHSTASSKDDLYRPSKITFAAGFAPFSQPTDKPENAFKIGLEINYIFWNSYKYVLFGEELVREFDNTALAALGLEFPINCFGLDLLLRGGYRLDPQPTSEPGVTLHWLSFGAGVNLAQITFDVAGSYCFGSLPSWTAQNYTIVATLGVRL